MIAVNSPLFCLTSDVDWSSDYAIRDLIDITSRYNIRPTLFATHKSTVLAEHRQRGGIELGIHPNFLPGSSHGSDVDAVIEHMCGEFPEARSYRCHAFFETSYMSRKLASKGFHYDSNLCLHLQPNLVPLAHQSGSARFPVFWEDDVHWTNTDGDWETERYLGDFLSPGLKILNVHPFFIATNIPNQQYYQQIKPHIKTLSEGDIEELRYKGKGARTFLLEVLDALASRGERFYTLAQLYQMLPIGRSLPSDDVKLGRQTVRSDDDYRRYWSLSDRERQEFLRQTYEERSATDVYATSRDYNVRELEIGAIKRFITNTGRLLDLGCGNGYTLLSLAQDIAGVDMVGVDFSQNLIGGANALLTERRSSLRSEPKFVLADAIKYVKECDEASLQYVVTERFLQNMPSVGVQQSLIRDIHRALAPGGRLLMCEGSENGFEHLNDLRDACGLSRIPATSSDNVTAIRFQDGTIEDFVQRTVGFRLIEKVGFSLYFTITRVLHPLLVAPQSPSFDAKINDLARKIQAAAPSDPGFGSNVLWVLEK